MFSTLYKKHQLFIDKTAVLNEVYADGKIFYSVILSHLNTKISNSRLNFHYDHKYITDVQKLGCLQFHSFQYKTLAIYPSTQRGQQCSIIGFLIQYYDTHEPK